MVNKTDHQMNKNIAKQLKMKELNKYYNIIIQK